MWAGLSIVGTSRTQWSGDGQNSHDLSALVKPTLTKLNSIDTVPFFGENTCELHLGGLIHSAYVSGTTKLTSSTHFIIHNVTFVAGQRGQIDGSFT